MRERKKNLTIHRKLKILNVNMIADFCWMLKRKSVKDSVKSANETRFTDLLMTNGLGKANDREVFVSHEMMDV